MNVSNSNLKLPYKKHKVRLRGEGYVRAEYGEMLSKAKEPKKTEEAWPRGSLKPSEGQRAFYFPWIWTFYGFQNCKGVTFCRFKPPSLWKFVTEVLEVDTGIFLERCHTEYLWTCSDQSNRIPMNNFRQIQQNTYEQLQPNPTEYLWTSSDQSNTSDQSNMALFPLLESVWLLILIVNRTRFRVSMKTYLWVCL